jgi:hypothetical protein
MTPARPPAPFLLRPERHTVRLGATFGGIDQLNRLDELAPCDALVRFIAHTFDEASFLHSLPTTRTISEVRALSPLFTGLLGIMPSAMMAESTLNIWRPDGDSNSPAFGDDLDGLDRNRADPVFAVTNAPVVDADGRVGWAIRLAQPASPEPLPGLVPAMPYPAFGKGKGTVVNPQAGDDPMRPPWPEQIPWPPYFQSSKRTRFVCEPEPFALHPVRGRDVFIRAVEAATDRLGAQGIFLDDLTPTYRATTSVQQALVVLNRPLPCQPGPELGRPEYALRASDGMFDVLPYANYRPDVCRGAQTTEDQQKACEEGLRTDRLALIRRAWETFERDADGRQPLIVWPNMYALFGNLVTGESVTPDEVDSQIVSDFVDRVTMLGAESAASAFQALYASRAGDLPTMLAKGGWWEKFTQDWALPTKEGMAAYFSALGVDGMRRVALPAEDPSAQAQFVAVHRLPPSLSHEWQHAIRWVNASARTGARVRVESGFTSIDDIQMALASYLLTRIVTPESNPNDPVPDSPRGWPSLGQRDSALGPLTLAPRLTFFPRFVSTRTAHSIDCTRPNHRCTFECARRTALGEQPKGFAPQALSAMHPEVLRAVFGAGPSAPNASTSMTPLRLLLDVELGRPLDFGRIGPTYVARFEHGEVVVLPFKSEQNADDPISRHDLEWHHPRHPGLYMTIDADVIDSIIGAGRTGRDAVVGRVPGWATTSFATGERLRQVLEAGLQDLGALLPQSPRAGVPGIKLRQANAAPLGVPLIPGMGRVIVYANSPTGRLWRRYFPTPAETDGGFVTQPIRRLLAPTHGDRASQAVEVDLDPGATRIMTRRDPRNC